MIHLIAIDKLIAAADIDITDGKAKTFYQRDILADYPKDESQANAPDPSRCTIRLERKISI